MLIRKIPHFKLNVNHFSWGTILSTFWSQKFVQAQDIWFKVDQVKAISNPAIWYSFQGALMENGSFWHKFCADTQC